MLQDLLYVSTVLNRLKEAGFGISLDDFGTGYSSLSYLNSLPISEIKIDRCFVDRIVDSTQSQSLVKSIIAIGRSCEMVVVAEGVETQEQYDQLMEYGCDLAQGYLVSRPLPFEAFSEYVSSYQ